MINSHEDVVMAKVITDLRDIYGTSIHITDSENNINIPKIPSISFYKSNDYITSSYRTLSTIEVGVTEVYTAVIYASTSDECKTIANVVDEIMQDMYYQRTSNTPSFDVDPTLSRRVCRWRGVHPKGSVD